MNALVVAHVRWRNKYDAPTTAHVRLGIVRSNGKERMLAEMDLWHPPPIRILSLVLTFNSLRSCLVHSKSQQIFKIFSHIKSYDKYMKH